MPKFSSSEQIILRKQSSRMAQNCRPWIEIVAPSAYNRLRGDHFALMEPINYRYDFGAKSLVLESGNFDPQKNQEIIQKRYRANTEAVTCPRRGFSIRRLPSDRAGMDRLEEWQSEPSTQRVKPSNTTQRGFRQP